MVFRKSVFLLLLALVPFCAMGLDAALKVQYLGSRSDSLRWESTGDETPLLRVSRYSGGSLLWKYETPDIGYYLNNHDFPLSAYTLGAKVVSFPVTTEKDDSGELTRRQIGLDAESGALLWERDVLCGISQRYFYSYTDGERIYIHNLHEYRGSQLLCLNLRTGETLWETEGLPQPALPLETEDYLVLHSALLREFMLIDKEDGSSRRYETSSPVLIFEDNPLYLRTAGGVCRVITLSAGGNEEVLFELPDGPDNGIYSYRKDHFSPFFRALHKPVLIPAVYRDSLILQRLSADGLHHLTAYSLSDCGRMLWEIALPQGESFNLEADFNNPAMYIASGNSSFILGYPELAVFNQISGRYLPLFIHDSQSSLSGYALIDLDEGRLEMAAQELYDMSAYIFQSILKSGGSYYYFLQRYSESPEGTCLVLKIDGSSGKFSLVHRYENNISDYEKWRMNPYLYLYQHSMDLLKWEGISAELIEQLSEDPGFSEEAFDLTGIDRQ